MTDAVLKFTCAPITPDPKNIMRYAGIGNITPELDALMARAVSEATEAICYRLCYRILRIEKSGETLRIGNITSSSKTLAKCIEDSPYAVVFAATTGIAIDRLISRTTSLSPSLALMLDAVATEQTEALCNEFQKSFGEKCGYRVSAGYGDIPLDMQKDIFDLLEPHKSIGLTLNTSLMMSPSKSVTAIFGLRGGDGDLGNACDECHKTTCEYRR